MFFCMCCNGAVKPVKGKVILALCQGKLVCLPVDKHYWPCPHLPNTLHPPAISGSS